MVPPLFRFSHQFSSKIWKVVIDAHAGVLVLELRETDEQEIHFAQINALSGALYYFEVKEADLWTAVIACHFPKLLLEQFTDPQNPNSKKLLIYDLEDHNLQQTLDGFQFEKFEDGEIKGFDLNEQGQERAAPIEISDQTLSYQLLSPTYFPPNSEGGEMICEFLEIESAGVGFEYLEKDEYIIICYYERLGTNFDRHLVVIKGDQEIFRTKLDSNMSGYASGSFFIYADLLIFIEHRNQLHAIEL